MILGFELVTEFEREQDQSYQFDLIGIWRCQSDGKLYLGQDSGCSCPFPWEDFTFDDLEPLTNLNQIQTIGNISSPAGAWTDFLAEVNNLLNHPLQKGRPSDMEKGAPEKDASGRVRF